MVTDAMVEAAVQAIIQECRSYDTPPPIGQSVDKFRYTIRCGLEAAEAARWQPIETAPKDRIVLICTKDGCAPGYFNDISNRWYWSETTGRLAIIEPLQWQPLACALK